MEKNSLLPFFEVLSSKINFCLLPKNTIARLGFRLPNLSHSTKISLLVFIFLVSSVSFAQLMPSSSYDLSRNAASYNNVNQQYDSWAYGQKIKKLANLTTHNPLISQWETIQSVNLVQLNSSSISRIVLAPVKINLDQVRNGSGASPIDPANWVNGNAGASNAHYVEGWSIPYRAVFTDLPVVVNAVRTIDIEWDIKHTDANAIDFITNYDLINFALGTHATNFGHAQETINPIFGFDSLSGFKDVENIPQPNLPATSPYPGAGGTFAAIQNAAGDKGAMTIWGGTIISMTYVSQGNLANSSASTRLRITFTNTSSTVVLSWGGHIAKASDWGLGNSASAVSGSPYHTRLISYSLDGGTTQISIGNQDRSLSAAAVVDPPACMLSGTTPVECNTQNTYTNSLTSLNGYTYSWTLIDNTSGANIASTDGFLSATVNSGTGCDKAYTLRFTLKNNNIEISHCDYTVAVEDNTNPEFASCPEGSDLGCNPESFPDAGAAVATDNCGTPSITSLLGDEVGAGCSKSRTRTYTATDACGNTATCEQVFTYTVDVTPPEFTSCPEGSNLGCNPEIFPDAGTAVAEDNCGGSPTIVVGDLGEAVNTEGCLWTRTRTYTATDACGNSSTCQQVFTYTLDVTPPEFTLCPAGSNLGCNPESFPDAGTAVAEDNCGGSPTIVVGDLGDAVNTEGCTWTRTRIYTATDACGNSSTCQQVFTYTLDTTPPEFTFCPAGSDLGCNPENFPDAGTAVAEDNCGGSPTIVVGDLGDAVNTEGCTWTRTRIYTATDDCGNSSTCQQVFTYVVDVTPPVFTSCPDYKEDQSTPVAIDACGTPTLGYDDSEPIQVGCQSVIIRTWTATDDCGNSATCIQHILMIDSTPPEITCNPDGSASATDDSGTVYLYQSGDVWTAIDASGNMSSKTCEEVGSKIAPSKQLKQTSTDTKKASTASNIETSKTEAVGFEVFPVPFKDQLTIKYKFDYESDVKIEVFNAQGILMLSKMDTNSYLNKEIALDLKFNKGKEQVYVVKVTTNKESIVKKVMSSQ